MNWSHVLRIAWKDYRRNGALWLVFVAFWLLCLTYVTATAFYTRNFIAPLTVAQTMLLVLTTATIYSLSWGAITFASEHEENTYGLLRSLPLNAKHVFYGKLFFGVNSTILLIATLGLICLFHSLVLQSRGGKYDWGTYDRDFGLVSLEVFCSGAMGILIPATMALGIFWSLRIKRPLVALSVTGVTAILVPYVCALAGAMLAEAIGDSQGSSESEQVLSVGTYGGSMLGLATIVLFAVDRRLVVRWLPNYSALETRGRTVVATPTPSNAGSSFGRLFWLQRRQNFWTCIALGASSLLFFFMAVDRLDAIVLTLAALLSAVLGIITFYHEHQDKRYRLLAQLGARPLEYWASRLLLPVVAAIAIAISVSPMGFSSAGSRYIGDGWWFAMALACCCLSIFSIAQFCSIACSSMIISIAATLLSAFVACFWIMLCAKIRVPSWLGFLPLVLLPLLASYLRVSRWFRDTGSWKQWLVPAVPMLLLILGVPLTTATHRVYEVPGVELPAALSDVPRPPTPQELAGAAAYRAVFAKLPPGENTYAWQIGGEDDPELVAWTGANSAVVDELAEVTQAISVFPEDYRYSWQPEHDIDGALMGASVLLISGQKAVEQNDVDAAWDYYAAALRLARHQNDRFAGLAAYLRSFSIERAVYRALIPWAMMPENTADKIEVAALFLDEYRQSQPPGSRALGNDYRYVISLYADPIQFYRMMDSAAQQRADVLLLLPWEVARAKRLTEYAYAKEFKKLRKIEAGETQSLDQIHFPDEDPRIEELGSTTAFVSGVGPIGPTLAHAEHIRRGTLYQLAAIVHHMRNGAYPPDFSQVKIRDRELPDDTFSPGKKLKLIMNHPKLAALIVTHRAGPETFSDGQYERLHFLLPDFDDGSVERFMTQLEQSTKSGRAAASRPSIGFLDSDRFEGVDTDRLEDTAKYFIAQSVGSPAFPDVLRVGIGELLRSGDDDTRVQILRGVRETPAIVKYFLPEITACLDSQNLTLAVEASRAIDEAISSHLLSPEQLTAYKQVLSTRENSTDVGVPIRNPGNDHYYELVHEYSTWNQAKAAASQRTFRGMEGYLVTITSAEEEFLVRAMTELADDGLYSIWTGGSKSEQDGTWKWVCGPESGEVFWRLDNDANAAGYTNWIVGEPSNKDGRDFLIWDSDPSFNSSDHGRWRAVNREGFGARTPPTVYIVEYSPAASEIDAESPTDESASGASESNGE